MKKILLLLFALVTCINAWGETTLSIDFESATSTYSDWTFVTLTSQKTNSAVSAHGGSYFGTTDGKTSGSVTTAEKIAYPSSITFYVSKQSTNTTSSSWKVQVSTNGTSWTTVKTASATSMTRGSWNTVTQDLSSYSNVYVRVAYDGSTAIRCIDDLTLVVSASAPQTTVAPSFSVEDGTYISAQTVSITSATEGASIYYTTDGTTPTASSTQYTSALNIAETTTVKAIAIKDNVSSTVATATYTIINTVGQGTKENPFTVDDVKTLNNRYSAAKVWVKGTIIGVYSTANNSQPTTAVEDCDTNLAIATLTDTIPVQLPSGSARTALNLKDKPGNMGLQIEVYGYLQNYFNIPGVREVTDYAIYDNETYEIDLTVGKFGTICLPRAVKSGNRLGATFYNIVSIDGSGITIEEETGDLVAGKPYIFKATDEMLLAELTGLPVSAPVVNNGLIGNLNVESVPVPENCYVLSNNKLRKVTVAGAAIVGLNKAYIDPSQIAAATPEPSQGQSGIRINFEENEGNETGVDAMKVNENVEVYDIMGRKVTNPTKGIYVINGKKVVIK